MPSNAPALPSQLRSFPVGTKTKLAGALALASAVLLFAPRATAEDGALIPCKDPAEVAKWERPRKAEVSRLRGMADKIIRGVAFTPKALSDSCSMKLATFLGASVTWGAVETESLEKVANCLELEIAERHLKCLCASHGMKYSSEGYKFMKEWEGVYTKGPKGYIKLIDGMFTPGGHKVSEYAAVPGKVWSAVPEDAVPESVGSLAKKMKEFEGRKDEPATLNPVINAWIKRTGELRRCFDEKTLATMQEVSSKLEKIDVKGDDGEPAPSISPPSFFYRATLRAPAPAAHDVRRAVTARATPDGRGEMGLVRGKSDVSKSDITGVEEDRAKRERALRPEEIGPATRTMEELLSKPEKPAAPVERRVGGVRVDVESKGTPEDLSAERNEILKMRKTP